MFAKKDFFLSVFFMYFTFKFILNTICSIFERLKKREKKTERKEYFKLKYPFSIDLQVYLKEIFYLVPKLKIFVRF